MSGRVLIADPWVDQRIVEEALRGADVEIEQTDVLEGDDVLAVIASINRPFGRAELERLPSLRVVSTCSTGYDHIDLAAAREAGVWVTHAGDYCADEVAEHTIAMVTALLRGLPALDRQVRAGEWDVYLILPRRIAGTTLGVVGCGRIGSRVCRLASALGMRVLATDPNVSTEAIRAVGAEPVDRLGDLLAASEVLTIHTWLDETTRGLIGAAELATLPRGAYLVNCARAGIVDHEALGEALGSGQLAGAALDVLPEEPPPTGAPELTWPETLLSPHAAWYSSQASVEVHRRPAHDILLVLSGREPLYPVVRPR